MRNATFQSVIDLKPHESLFPWTSSVNLGLGPLQKAIDEMEERASSLSPKPSPDEISKLKKACTTFRDAVRGFNSAKHTYQVH
jgi:hypothetical protein